MRSHSTTRKKDVFWAICGTLLDKMFLLCFMALFLLLFRKTFALPAFCFISGILLLICLIQALFLWFRPDYLERYHVIPKKKKTTEQVNAMLFVIQRQPYIIDNYPREAALIADSFAKRNDQVLNEEIVNLYEKLMNGNFEIIPTLIQNIINTTN